MYLIVERSIGRAGNKDKAKRKQQLWDSKYGKGKWVTGYEVNNNFLTRKDAIKEIYNKSYFKYLDENPEYVKQLINSAGVFNPHAVFSNSYDIQAYTIEVYMEKNNLEFTGEKLIPIGTFQPRKISNYLSSRIKELGLSTYNGRINYPPIARALSPFNVPYIYNPTISIEDFWQSEAKCLAVKIDFHTQVGNLFDISNNNEVVCITTNGVVNKNGEAVMGVGTAKFARDNFKGIDKKLGTYIKKYGNRAFNLGKYTLNNKTLIVVSFPTKEHWKEDSNLTLIKESVNQLIQMANKFKWGKIYLPMPGGGAGRLSWADIRKELLKLDERVTIVSLKEEDFD